MTSDNLKEKRISVMFSFNMKFVQISITIRIKKIQILWINSTVQYFEVAHPSNNIWSVFPRADKRQFPQYPLNNGTDNRKHTYFDWKTRKEKVNPQSIHQIQILHAKNLFIYYLFFFLFFSFCSFIYKNHSPSIGSPFFALLFVWS